MCLPQLASSRQPQPSQPPPAAWRPTQWCRWDQVADGGDGGSFRDEAAVDMIRRHNEEARQLNAEEEGVQAAARVPAARVAATDGQLRAR